MALPLVRLVRVAAHHRHHFPVDHHLLEELFVHHLSSQISRWS